MIDPRRTATRAPGPTGTSPRSPGTDGVLALGIAHVLVAENWHDEAWLAAHTVGWPQLRERLAEFPPERVARETRLAGRDDRRAGASCTARSGRA